MKNTQSANRDTFKNGTTRILRGLVLAIVLNFLGHDAMGGSVLHILFNTDLVNTGADADAKGKMNGMLTRQGNANNQTLRVLLTKLAPNTTYQLLVFIGEDSNPRGL